MNKDYNSLARHIILAHDWYRENNMRLWEWEDEGIVWTIQDYLSCKGEFSDADIKTLKKYGFLVSDFIENIEEDELKGGIKNGKHKRNKRYN